MPEIVTTRSPLVTRLFVPESRWGWEFLTPVQPVPFTEAAPVRQQVFPPQNLAKLEYASKRAWRGLIRNIVIALVLGVIIEAVPHQEVTANIVFLAGILAAVVWFLYVRNRFKRAKGSYEAAFYGADGNLAREIAAWEQRHRDHDLNERDRAAASAHWDPVWTNPRPSRVDVYGGTTDGWASLLTTAGAAALAQGGAMVVLDFTEAAVVDELVDMALACGHQVDVRELPRSTGTAGLLAGLDANEIGDIIAEAVHTFHATAMSQDLRTLHSALLTAAGRELRAPITFARVSAALRVLQRTYDPSVETLLAPEEFRALNAAVDTVGSNDQARAELRTLSDVLSRIAGEEEGGSAPASPGALWPATGLSVTSTSASTTRTKNLLDQIVFHRTVAELERRRNPGRCLLVLAGVDQIDLNSLEALTRQARRSGVEVILLFEHLRDDLQKLLGGSDSLAMFMRLGNPVEAAFAADFIGRGHKFILSQLTRETGESLTRGESHGRSGSYSTGTEQGFSKGASSGPGGGRNFSKTQSSSSSRTNGWEDSVNSARTDSTGRSASDSRVYEYSVEPTTIQGLAITAFVMVTVGRQGGRRIVVGDCNPGIALLDTVSATPTSY